MELAGGIMNDEEAVKAVDMQSEDIIDADFKTLSASIIAVLTP